MRTDDDLKVTGVKLRRMFVTTGEDNIWERQDINGVMAKEDAGLKTISLEVDPNKRYQPIDGFGASFTDSSAFLINQVLEPADRDALMTRLFDPVNGIGLSFVRNPMGSSDFARRLYSYDDMPEGESDFELERFSIDHDREDILPLTKRALELNPRLKLMATPWSPPGWMKTSGQMIGGSLLPSHYDVYGDYFMKFLEEYRKEGVEFSFISPQNEPMYTPGHYPGCSMPAKEQIKFINTSLGPKLRERFPNVKLLCWDHNWDKPEYPLAVLEEAGEYVDGVAWHVYGGTAASQSVVYKKFPDKEVHFTEASGGEWVPPFSAAFYGNIRTSIRVLNNYSRSVVLWNIALDEKNGPTVPGFGRSTCRGVVTVNQRTRELRYNLDYYALAHFSRYIRPGAVRVESETKSDAYTTAALNADNSLVIIACNEPSGARNLRFDICGSRVFFRAPGRSVVTLVVDLNG